MENEQDISGLVDELKYHLQSKGWEVHHAEIVVDGMVEGFRSDLLLEGLGSYDDMARNQGAGTPPPFDEKAITLLDEIKRRARGGR